jgi:DNA-binding transcriptional regulator YhcF (GntR family)
MTSEHEFVIDRRSETPLYSQLHEQLKRFVEIYPEQTRLPSERKLSETLGIDRATVQNALQPLLDNGRIFRRGSRGTFIAPKDKNDRDTCPHPMLAPEGLFTRRTGELKIMLYENYLPHQEFWSRVTDRFEKKNPEIALQLQWVPNDISHETYDDYIRNVAPDIVQTFWHYRRSALLSRLPDSFLQELLSDDYCFEHLSGYRASLFDCLVPVYFSPCWLFIDKSMVQRYGLARFMPKACGGELVAALPEINRRHPELLHAGMLWDIFQKTRGYPADSSPAASLRPLEDVYSYYDHELHGRLNMPPPGEQNPVAAFLNGESLFGLTYFLGLNMTAHTIEDRYLRYPAISTPEYLTHSGTSCMGIFKDARNKISALRFLEFIISDEVQAWVPELLGALAFKKAVNLKHYAGGGILGERETVTLMNITKSFYHMDNPPVSAICDETKPYFLRYIQGKLSRTEALELSRIKYAAIYRETTEESQFDSWRNYKP